MSAADGWRELRSDIPSHYGIEDRRLQREVALEER